MALLARKEMTPSHGEATTVSSELGVSAAGREAEVGLNTYK